MPLTGEAKRQYQREWHAERMKSDRDYVRRRSHRRKSHKIRLGTWYRNLKYVTGCWFCSEYEPCCLDYHHLDPTTKEMCLSDMVFKHRFARARVLEEIKKCILLCSNCHRKVESGLLIIGVEGGG